MYHHLVLKLVWVLSWDWTVSLCIRACKYNPDADDHSFFSFSFCCINQLWGLKAKPFLQEWWNFVCRALPKQKPATIDPETLSFYCPQYSICVCSLALFRLQALLDSCGCITRGNSLLWNWNPDTLHDFDQFGELCINVSSCLRRHYCYYSPLFSPLFSPCFVYTIGAHVYLYFNTVESRVTQDCPKDELTFQAV